jgi:hypothetical protein
MRIAAGCLTIAIGLASVAGASACGSSPAHPAALETRLSCAGSLTESLVVDYDSTGRDTRAPDQQAKEYGAVVGGAFAGKRNVVYRSKERIDIAFTNGQGRIQAVLSYRNHTWRGWRLENGANCA